MAEHDAGQPREPTLRRSSARLIAALLLLGLLAVACSDATDEAEPSEPTPTMVPSPPTATPDPTADPSPTPVDIPTPTATAEPTQTPEPSPTASPTPTAAPTTAPTATVVPPTATVAPPTATATPTPGLPVSIGCRIRPTRPVAPGEILIFTALQDPPTVPVSYVFDHGDGTLDPGPVSRAYYESAGLYEVRLNWAYDGRNGSVLCGTVTVVDVGPGTPTPTPTTGALTIGCTISPDRPVAVGEILTYTAVQSPPSVPVSYVFDHGDGTLDPGSVSFAFYAAPGTYDVKLNWAALGDSGTVFCGTVTVLGATTPTPTPIPTATVLPISIGCQIDPQGPVTVRQILVYTAFQNPPDLDVQYVFDHGDGTLDPGPVSWAYYAAPGNYSVVLRWTYQGRAGSVFCGVVTVTA